MNVIKILFFALAAGFTATSCVSNYVVSTSQYTPPRSTELLANNTTKGPNATATSTVLKSEPLSMPSSPTIKNINNYAENKISLIEYNIVEIAKTYLGTPYRYGGTTRYGIDCSSFVQQVFQASNFFLPRTAASQSAEGLEVFLGDLRRGDLLFFSNGRGISHVGIVESISETGEVFFIHAASSQGVTISSLDDPYWVRRFRMAKRIITDAEDFLAKNDVKGFPSASDDLPSLTN